MATNQTANYQLNQWEPTDQVLRTDFNADNAKLDAALAEKAEVETVSALQTAVASKAEQTALAALAARVTALEARPYIVTGTYTGDGTASQFIFLGFTPKALLVVGAWSAMSRDNSYYGGFALEGKPAGGRDGNETGGKIFDGGFMVFYAVGGGEYITSKEAKRQNYYIGVVENVERWCQKHG